ncbi:hypothetical protein EDD85DRAFT_948329 [Armillaria nabsnona]|nr:hypothetical protein EDD85DRAFT_948329 [Armillaria nabsnona]
MSKPSTLEKIYAQRAKDVELASSTPGALPEDIDRLKQNPASTSSISLMAEIKRASPSKRPIVMKIDSAQRAWTYTRAGASVIFTLTEPSWFDVSGTFDVSSY